MASEGAYSGPSCCGIDLDNDISEPGWSDNDSKCRTSGSGNQPYIAGQYLVVLGHALHLA